MNTIETQTIGFPPPEQFAALLASKLAPGVLESLQQESQYEQYQDDPVGFIHDVLHETLTPDMQKLMESVRDNEITIGKSCNGPGKTFTAARIAVWFKKCFLDAQVYTAAAPPEDNLRRLLWGEIGEIVETHPDLFKNERKRDLHIQSSSLSFLTGVTIPSSGTKKEREAKFSGKHAPNLLFILDEGDAIPDEVYQGIEGCMSGGHVRLLILFNPRSEVGEVYRMERDNRANVIEISAFTQPNVIENKIVIPGAVDRKTTVRRINQWCRPVVEGEKGKDVFDLPGFLAGEVGFNQNGREYPPLKAGKYEIINSAFSYMVLGRYPAQSAQQLISREWTASARSRWDLYVAQYGEVAPAGTRGIAGQDVAESGDDFNVFCIRHGGWVPRLVRWNGIDTHETGERAEQEFHFRNGLVCYVDATGIGAGVAPHMRKLGCNAHSVKVAEKPTETTELGDFKILRDQLWWSVREWLRTDPGAMLPPDEELLEDLHRPDFIVKNGKVRVMDKDTMKEELKRSPDKGDALCLTFAKAGKTQEIADLEGCFV